MEDPGIVLFLRAHPGGDRRLAWRVRAGVGMRSPAAKNRRLLRRILKRSAHAMQVVNDNRAAMQFIANYGFPIAIIAAGLRELDA
jgi:hypothetical protein